MKIIKGDVVSKNGVYVVYTQNDISSFDFADKILLVYVDGSWYYPKSDQKYRGVIYGCIGPLPAKRICDIGKPSTKYAIGDKYDGLGGCFKEGPFDDIQELLDSIRSKGDRIFKLKINEEPVAIYKWKKKKWKKLKNRP